MGATGADLDAEEEPAGFREAYRILKVIPTVRTMWFSLPFLFGGVLGLLIVVPLFLEDVYGLDAAERGLLTAFQGAFGIFGLFLGTALTKRYLFSDKPQRMFRLMAGHLDRDRDRPLLPRGRRQPGADDHRRHVPRDAVLAGAPRLRHPLLDHHAGQGPHGRLRHHQALGPPGARHAPVRRCRRRRPRPALGAVASLPVFVVGSLIIGAGGRSFQSDMAAAHEASMAAIRQRTREVLRREHARAARCRPRSRLTTDADLEAAMRAGMAPAFWAARDPHRPAVIAPSGDRTFGELNAPRQPARARAATARVRRGRRRRPALRQPGGVRGDVGGLQPRRASA